MVRGGRGFPDRVTMPSWNAVCAATSRAPSPAAAARSATSSVPRSAPSPSGFRGAARASRATRRAASRDPCTASGSHTS